MSYSWRSSQILQISHTLTKNTHTLIPFSTIVILSHASPAWQSSLLLIDAVEACRAAPIERKILSLSVSCRSEVTQIFPPAFCDVILSVAVAVLYDLRQLSHTENSDVSFSVTFSPSKNETFFVFRMYAICLSFLSHVDDWVIMSLFPLKKGGTAWKS